MNLNTEERMKKVIEVLESKLTTIRAGRANPSMLNGLMVDYYGTPTLINSVANITVPEAKQLFIKPFDKSALKNIEKAINESNLGLTPNNNGEMIIITIPELTEDRRREYVKMAKSQGEEAKISLRNIEDEEKLYLEDVQELINTYNKIVDDKVKEKEAELMQI